MNGMDINEVLNVVLGGGLLGTLATIATLRSTVRKANAEAKKAEADADTVCIDNAEHATRILVENIVRPLKEELNDTKKELSDTKKELSRNTREMARLRKALDAATGCDFHDNCPVLVKLRNDKDEHRKPERGGERKSPRQHECRDTLDSDKPDTDGGGDTGDSDGQSSEAPG